MKLRSIYALMITTGIAWMLCVNQSFRFLNRASDFFFLIGLLTFFGSFVIFPTIFVKLFDKLKTKEVPKEGK